MNLKINGLGVNLNFCSEDEFAPILLFRTGSGQLLRYWFANKMAEQGVQDRYIDAFCGRTPKSVLARHYTDYSPERLKRIYDKANLKIIF